MVGVEALWCQCRGNASATPHEVLIHRQVEAMHSKAEGHALCYVLVVIGLYVVGLLWIVGRSAESERTSALSALAFCCSQASASGRATTRRLLTKEEAAGASSASARGQPEAKGREARLSTVA